MKKNELLKECLQVLQSPCVSAWYAMNLEKSSQYETINVLEEAIKNDALSIREALSICLIVGVQWNEKFEGTK